MKNHLFVAKDNALKRYGEAVKYLNKELEIIESVGYIDSGKFCDQFIGRAKDFILGASRDKNCHAGMEDFPRDVKDGCLVERTLYLSRVVDYLKEKSKDGKYAPAEGSFWEFMGKDLEKLAFEVEKEGLF